MNLISAEEVISIAFGNKNTNPLLIKSTMIDAAQERHIRPILNNLYDILIVNPALLTGYNLILYQDYLVPSLAYYVKYEVLPDLTITTGSKGTRVSNDEFTNLATDKQRAEIAEKTKDFADALRDKMLRYINDNITYYPDYNIGLDVTNRTTRFFGIVLDGYSDSTTKENEK